MMKLSRLQAFLTVGGVISAIAALSAFEFSNSYNSPSNLLASFAAISVIGGGASVAAKASKARAYWDAPAPDAFGIALVLCLLIPLVLATGLLYFAYVTSVDLISQKILIAAGLIFPGALSFSKRGRDFRKRIYAASVGFLISIFYPAVLVMLKLV